MYFIVPGGSAFIKDRREFSSYYPVASAASGSRIPIEEERLALAAITTALELGAEVHATDNAGNTALHAAASHGMDTLVQTLVDHGANIRATNRRGQTPMALAVYSDGIGGDREARESTTLLLRELETRTHPITAHRHPEDALPLPRRPMVNGRPTCPTPSGSTAAVMARSSPPSATASPTASRF